MQKRINFQNTKFILSAAGSSQFLTDKPAVAFLGRSNVGKSSLINSLVYSNLMKTSKSPGVTKFVNYALVDNTFYIVDLPGYGYASGQGELFSSLFSEFIRSKNLKKIYLLVDSRRLLLPADADFIDYLNKEKIPFSIIFTKSDKLNLSDKHFLALQKEKLGDANFFDCSIKIQKSIESIRKDIIQSI